MQNVDPLTRQPMTNLMGKRGLQFGEQGGLLGVGLGPWKYFYFPSYMTQPSQRKLRVCHAPGSFEVLLNRQRCGACTRGYPITDVFVTIEREEEEMGEIRIALGGKSLPLFPKVMPDACQWLVAARGPPPRTSIVSTREQLFGGQLGSMIGTWTPRRGLQMAEIGINSQP